MLTIEKPVHFTKVFNLTVSNPLILRNLFEQRNYSLATLEINEDFATALDNNCEMSSCWARAVSN